MRPRASTSLAAVLALAAPLFVLPSALAAPAPLPTAAAAATPLSDLVTEEAVYGHLEQFQAIAEANDGNRAFNTSGYEASAAYLEQVLQAAGYETERQVFVLEDAFEESTLELAGSDAEFGPWAFASSPYTPAPVTAELVRPGDAGRLGCEAADWAGIDVTGKIAFVMRGTCNFSQKTLAAAAAGAAVVLIGNNAPGFLNGTLGDVELPEFVPTAGLTQAEAAVLTAALDNGPATATAFVSMSDAETFNLLAETPTGRADNVVMLGAHLDGVEEGAGINDNASGSAALLETAVQLIEQGPVNNKVRFAWWGAEELGLFGSDHYIQDLLDNNPGELDNIATYLNFDMIASPNYIIGVYDADESTYTAPVPVPDGSIATEKVFTDWFDSIDQPWVDTEFSGRSDYAAFIANGIPSSGLFTGADDVKTAEEVEMFGGTAGVIHDPNYHTVRDDITNVNREALAIMIAAIAHATETLAADTWAVNGVATPGDAPTVAITDPEPRSSQVGDLVVSGTAADDYGLAGDEVALSLQSVGSDGRCGDTSHFLTTAPVVDGTWTATWEAGVVTDGKYCVTATATDNAGQATSAQLFWIQVSDGLPRLTDLEVSVRCLQGNVVLTARAFNGEDRKVDIRITSPFHTQKFDGVAAGKAALSAKPLTVGSIAAGSMTFAAYYWADGRGFHETYTVPYAARSCS